METVKSNRNKSVPDKCECPSEITPQKINEDSIKQISADKNISLEMQNNLTLKEPLKQFTYNIHEKQDESEAETDWHNVLDVVAQIDSKDKSSDMEQCTEKDFAIKNMKKIDDIPLKFDEMPPEPSWTTVSHVVVKDAKDNSISDKVYHYEDKGLPQRHVNRRSSCPENHYFSNIHKKLNNPVLDVMPECDYKNNENSDEGESTEIESTISDWKKVDSIPLKFDELPPEPRWETVSNVVVKNKKNNSISDKKYDYGEKVLQQRHANRRSSCPDNRYSKETKREKPLQMKVSKDEMRDGSWNRGNKLEDLEQKDNSYRYHRDTNHMHHDQYYPYQRSSTSFTSPQMSSVPYRPRDPSPDYD
ncbi:uncharacterized protein [Palaemon carinicauda]|uniref:uncharacterized protein n=1 Tax=Palaemon carinicauda TaxID=392227 RepID=UPI0035B60D45